MTEFPNRIGRPVRNDLVYPELSYHIVGTLFSIHKMFGNHLLEKHYQKALSDAFMAAKIPFAAQVPILIQNKQSTVGKLFADFVIADKIVLEIKAVPRLTTIDYQQITMYLDTLNKELGILANFRPRQLTFRRILNTSFGYSV